jgi:tellurite resistance protein TerC
MMLEVTALGWAATIGLIGALLALDLLIATRRPHAVGFGEAVVQSLFYISVAIAFGVVFGVIAGWEFGTEYFAGYIVEKSLSVDDMLRYALADAAG